MAGKAEESKEIYFFDASALLARYLTRESGIRKINEIFTSYAQIYTSGLAFGEAVAELKRTLDPSKAEAILPLLLADVKSGRLKILEIQPGPIQEEVGVIREIEKKHKVGPLGIFGLALTRFFLKKLHTGKAPVLVSTDKAASALMKELGHEVIFIEA